MDVSHKNCALSQCLIDRISVRYWGLEAWDITRQLSLTCCLSYFLSCFCSFSVPVTDNVGPFLPWNMCWCLMNCFLENLTPNFNLRKGEKLHAFWNKLSWFEFILLNHHIRFGSWNSLCTSIFFFLQSVFHGLQKISTTCQSHILFCSLLYADLI